MSSPPTPSTVASDDEDVMPWEDGSSWVPMTRTGKQKTPNQIRSELQRYLNDSGRTTKSVMEEMGASSRSYYTFMTKENYKNMWSACKNDTYWKAAKFLFKLEKENKKQSEERSMLELEQDQAAKRCCDLQTENEKLESKCSILQQELDTMKKESNEQAS